MGCRLLLALLFAQQTTTAAAAASDRLIEFSSRTLPRLDQLAPSPVPTVLVGEGDDAEAAAAAVAAGWPIGWVLGAADRTIRPASNRDLCLYALALHVAAPVALYPCANVSTRAIQRRQWRWAPAAGQLSSAEAPDLCRIATIDLATSSGTRRISRGTRGQWFLWLMHALTTLNPDCTTWQPSSPVCFTAHGHTPDSL